MVKKFKINENEIKQLIQSNTGSLATDAIMVDGLKIGYAYREKPINNNDNGWRFFSGTETQDYLDDLSNTGVYSINTIANYDSSIIPFLDLPYGTELERIKGKDDFEIFFNE